MLKSEAVLFTAHWDHLGVGKSVHRRRRHLLRRPRQCHRLAILLEMARALGRHQSRGPNAPRSSWPPPPRRAACSAPPTTPSIRSSRSARPRSISTSTPCFRWACRSRSSSAARSGPPPGRWCRRSRASTSSPSSRTRTPHLGFYYRSDHFALARGGVPAFSVSCRREDPGQAGRLRPEGDGRVHRQGLPHAADEYHEDWDFRGYPVLMRFAFDIAQAAANAKSLPTWNAGDEFLKARKRGV